MRRIHLIALLVIVAILAFSSSPTTQAQSNSHFFAETGHTVKGKFWQYWQQHGGLAQQGYPISDEMQEVSDLNGQTYTVQYFERAEFELHPENQPPNDVLLSQLGTFRYKEKYSNVQPPTSGPQPTATAIPVPSGNPTVQLMQQVSYVDSIGYSHILLLVKNIGGGTAGNIKATATLFNSSGNVIGTDDTSEDYPLASGQSIGLEVLISNKAQPAKTDISLDAQAYNGGDYDNTAQNLSAGNDTMNKDSIGFYHIQGLAKNNSDKEAKDVEVQATCYDGSGKIVAVDTAFVNDAGAVTAGQAAPFSIIVVRSDITIANYTLNIKGEQQ
jgi:hypothetical protein